MKERVNGFNECKLNFGVEEMSWSTWAKRVDEYI